MREEVGGGDQCVVDCEGVDEQHLIHKEMKGLPSRRKTLRHQSGDLSIETTVITGDIGFRQSTQRWAPDAPNWPTFLTFANKTIADKYI